MKKLILTALVFFYFILSILPISAQDDSVKTVLYKQGNVFIGEVWLGDNLVIKLISPKEKFLNIKLANTQKRLENAVSSGINASEIKPYKLKQGACIKAGSEVIINIYNSETSVYNKSAYELAKLWSANLKKIGFKKAKQEVAPALAPETEDIIKNIKDFDTFLDMCHQTNYSKYNQVDYNELGLVILGVKPSFWGGVTSHIDTEILKFKSNLESLGLKITDDKEGRPIVYNPNLIDKIIQSAPDFYSQFGKTTEEILLNAFAQRKQGELLGYGTARQISDDLMVFHGRIKGSSRSIISFGVKKEEIAELSKRYKEAIEKLTGKEAEIIIRTPEEEKLEKKRIERELQKHQEEKTDTESISASE